MASRTGNTAAPAPAPATLSRRHFATLMATSSLSACGEGGSAGNTPAPPNPPVLSGGLSLVAGGLGGTGYQPGVGDAARLPGDFCSLTLNADGEALFASAIDSDTVPNWGRVTPQGQVSYFRGPFKVNYWASSSVVDARNRVLVFSNLSAAGPVLYRLEGQQFVVLAGSGPIPEATRENLMDGQGTAARIGYFGSPVLGPRGWIYFLDGNVPDTVLRAVDETGNVTSLLSAPYGAKLLYSGSGALRLVTSDDSLATHPKTWYELAQSADGSYHWQTLAHQWPGSAQKPWAPALGSTDTYWTLSEAQPTRVILQRLNGMEVRSWSLPGAGLIQRPAAVDPSTGHLVVAVSIGNSMTLLRFDPTSDTPTQWCGKPGQPGQVDSMGEQARFDFSGGAEAFTGPAGELYVTSVGDQGPQPMRVVGSQGQVASRAFPKGKGKGLVPNANGDWVTSTGNQFLRAPQTGNSDWTAWVTEASSGVKLAQVSAIRQDVAGQVWFAEAYQPSSTMFPSAAPKPGGGVIAQIDRNGRVSVVVGDLNTNYTDATYPPIAQRPWYFDVTDFRFESTAVAWLLCNRPVLQNGAHTDSQHELVRVEGSVVRSWTLPATYPGGLQSYTRMCLLPGRPGEVFLASTSTVFRWTEAAGLTVLAGNPAYAMGVKLGALPAGLGFVHFLEPGPTANSLYIGSEHSVLRLDLPA